MISKKDSSSEYSELYLQTKSALLTRERGVSHIGGISGCKDVLRYPIPLEMAKKINWASFMKDCQQGRWGDHAKRFDWVAFFVGAVGGIPVDPFRFVDDMLVNGIVVESGTGEACKQWLPQLIQKVYGLPSSK